MKNIAVIYELVNEFGGAEVIGVVDTLEKAEEIIKEYYGEHKVLSHQNIREGNIEYSKLLEVKDHEQNLYKVKIYLEWFTLNSL